MCDSETVVVFEDNKHSTLKVKWGSETVVYIIQIRERSIDREARTNEISSKQFHMILKRDLWLCYQLWTNFRT